MLTAGFSKVCISPPVGTAMAGYAARQGGSEGTHDDIFVRSLVLEADGKAMALVSVDVLALSAELIAELRQRIERRTSIPRTNILIAATHTHAAPVTITTFCNPDEPLDPATMDQLTSAVEQACARAWSERFPARVGVGAGRVTDISNNRRTPDRRPVDEAVGLIRIDDQAGRTRAVVVHYACHPTVLGPDNRRISGDFPAFAIERIEHALGPDTMAMYLNGTQGNLSVGHASELSAIGIITPGRTFERARELGFKLGDAALAALPAIDARSSIALDVVTWPCPLPLKTYPSPAHTATALADAETALSRAPTDEVARKKSERLYASIDHFYAREAARFQDGVFPVELVGLRIGDAVFVGVPAEVFVELGLQIKQRARHPVFIVGLANGYIGYLPTAESYAAGGYEVVSSRLAPEAASVLVNAVLAVEDRAMRST
ncbi:MAG: neutral/alkaline non-lysosomal ceramidase N-terminal domain-containing protein [Kofleriaceae bacterium]